MVTVNCTSILWELYESECFVDTKGAFTVEISDRFDRFELSNRDALFLDEVG